MTQVLTIAARELRERNRIFIAAIAFAILPYLSALLPGARAAGRTMIITLVGGLLAVAMGLGVSVALGASVIGRELAEKRLSFLFSKPISPAAIWWGKAIAALIAATASFAIILVPSLFVGIEAWQKTWTVELGSMVVLTLVAAVALFFIAHAASTMIRSRSALLALDVLLVAVAAYVLYLLALPLIAGIALRLLGWLGLAVGVAIVLILAIGPVWQLDRGRTDRVRSHAALSQVVWGGIGSVLLIVAAIVFWVVSATPADLMPYSVGIEQSPDGRTTVLVGNAAHRLDYHAAFVVDENGKAERFTVPPWWSVEFSRGGSAIAWRSFANEILANGFRSPRDGEVMVRRRGERPVATGLKIGPRGSFVLSDDGARIAVIEGENVSVHDVARNELLVSARALTRGRRVAGFFFLTPDVVRIVERTGSQRDETKSHVRVVDVDLRSRSARTVVELDATVKSIGFSPEGRMMIVRGEGLVVDVERAAVVKTLATPTNWAPWSALLADGTTVTRQKSGDAVVFQISAPDGSVKTVPVANATSAGLHGLVGPRRMLVSIYRGAETAPSKGGLHRAIALLDLEKGEITNVLEGAAIASWFWSDDTRLQTVDPTRVAAIASDGKPVLVNVLTGSSRPLVKG